MPSVVRPTPTVLFSLQGGAFGTQGMLKEGTKHMSGLQEATYKNIDAAKQLSSCVRTSLGPNGMNKMVRPCTHTARALFSTPSTAAAGTPAPPSERCE
jgi:hypothetical protein